MSQHARHFPVWVKKSVKLFDLQKSERKSYKSTVFLTKDGAFLAAGTGFEPATSGL